MSDPSALPAVQVQHGQLGRCRAQECSSIRTNRVGPDASKEHMILFPSSDSLGGRVRFFRCSAYAKAALDPNLRD